MAEEQSTCQKCCGVPTAGSKLGGEHWPFNCQAHSFGFRWQLMREGLGRGGKQDAQASELPGAGHQISTLDSPPTLGHHSRLLLTLPGDPEAPASPGQWGFVLSSFSPGNYARAAGWEICIPSSPPKALLSLPPHPLTVHEDRCFAHHPSVPVGLHGAEPAGHPLLWYPESHF